jgi:hypothetical protein
MPPESLSLCELWDMTPPTIPARSRFYHLAPVGLGTPYVESLTSYITRLAEAHCLSTRTLVAQEILPRLAKPYLLHPNYDNSAHVWLGRGRLLNGLESWAQAGAQALETLTARPDLRFLTMSPWANVLSSWGLLRSTRAWCAACYEEWRQTGQLIYDPLLWALEVVEICPRHGQPLAIQCPQTGCRAEPVLAPHALPGYCSQCGGWLGRLNHKRPPDASRRQGALRWPVWVAHSVGAMLAAAPTIPQPPRRENIAEAVSTCIHQFADGQREALAHQLRLTPTPTLRLWHLGLQLPQLAALLELCSRFGLSPLGVLTEGAKAVHAPRLEPFIPKALQTRAPRHRQFDAEKARQALEAVLACQEQPPPSMTEVIRRLGYNHSHLHLRFPELCRAISARWRAYQRTVSEAHKQQICDQIQQATAQLHTQGIEPRWKNVGAFLGKPGYIRSPRCRAAWLDALRQLGLESVR